MFFMSKKMKKNIFLLIPLAIVIALFFSSCLLLLGIKTPKELPIEDLNNFLLKHRIDTSQCYAFNRISYDSIKKESYKPRWEKGFRPIQFKVFNSSGKLIAQYASCEGFLRKLRILDSYPPINVFPLDSNQTLINDLKMYRDYSGNEIDVSNNDYDLFFVVYWATCLGKPSLNMMKEVYKYPKTYPNKRIRIIKVNVEEVFR